MEKMIVTEYDRPIMMQKVKETLNKSTAEKANR